MGRSRYWKRQCFLVGLMCKEWTFYDKKITTQIILPAVTHVGSHTSCKIRLWSNILTNHDNVVVPNTYL